jgi:hypothetical protein
LGTHITHISNIVKKKIHALRKILTDLNPFELLGIAHQSIYSVLNYAADIWLNGVYKKTFPKTQSSLIIIVPILFG